jgi:tetratricopeptide (TPR) repeat protein
MSADTIPLVESPSPKWSWAIPLLLLASLAVYCNSFAGVFLLDDRHWIVDGELDRSLLPAWWNLSNRWVANWTLALNYQLDGLNVRGYHAVNLAIHVAAALTLFGIVRRTLLLERVPPTVQQAAPGLALSVALLWLVHPLVTQSVVYVIQRQESFMGLFYLLTLYCVLRGATALRFALGWYAAAVVACTLGMGCKEVMVSAPVLVLLYDWVFLAGSWRNLFRRRWYVYAALSLAWLHLAFLWMIQWGTLAQGGAGFELKERTAYTYALTQTQVILHYLKLTFWPRGLCFDYKDWPLVHHLSECWVEAAVLLLLGTGSGVALLKQSWLGLLGTWFFAVLAPSSSVLPLLDVAFEHRMYLPLAAVVVLVVVGGFAVLDRLGRLLKAPDSWPTRAGAFVVAGLAILLGALAFLRNEDYRSEVVMWGDVTAKRPNNARAYFNLASASRSEERVGDAVTYFRAALRLNPSEEAGRFQLVGLLLDQGEVEEAEAESLAALQHDPTSPLALASRGIVRLEQGLVDEAVSTLKEALLARPQMGFARYALATALVRQGRAEEAAIDVRMIISIDRRPVTEAAGRARQLVLKEQPTARDVRQAVTQAEPACLDPRTDGATLRDTLAIAYALTGRFDDAVTSANRALELATAAGQGELADQVRHRLRLYQARRAFRYAPSGS